MGQPEPPDADGWQRVPIRFDTAEIAAEYALSFGPQLEVLEPAALREQVIGLAKSTVAFYASRV